MFPSGTKEAVLITWSRAHEEIMAWFACGFVVVSGRRNKEREQFGRSFLERPIFGSQPKGTPLDLIRPYILVGNVKTRT